MQTIIFHVLFSVPALYVIVRTLLPLRAARWAKVLAVVVILAGSQFHQFNLWSSGSRFDPEFPRWLVMTFNAAFVGILLLAVGQIVVDLGALLIAMLKRRRVVIAAALRLSLSALAVLLASLSVWNATRLPKPRVVEVAVANLPPAFEGYRILQLTDLHQSRLFDAAWARRLVDAANAQQADIMLITGDLIDGTVTQRREQVAPLSQLRAADGVWISSGNHEYYFGQPQWMAHDRTLGMRTLENAHTVVRRGVDALVVAAVNDPSGTNIGLPGPDLAVALRGAPANAPVILMDHQPRNAPVAAARGVALQLSGHTHGGMLVGLDRIVALSNNGFVRGRYQVGGMTLYVSPGTALWPGFAARLGTANELTVIRLVRAVT